MPARTGDEALVSAWFDLFTRFLRLGLTAFGGPVAHLGYFRTEFVERARWLDDATFAEIVAICSSLPGPSSSQVGITIGWRRAGIAGALLAWIAFSVPSALAMAAFGLALRGSSTGGAGANGAAVLAGALDALAGAAAAVVLIAVIQLCRSLVTTSIARAIASCTFVLALGVDRWMPSLQWTLLLLAAAAGARFGTARTLPPAPPPLRISRSAGIAASITLVVLLATLPFFAGAGSYVALTATFFRAGSLVFGGGHVVLPFLQNLIGTGRIDTATFFAGYGAAQAVPGPLFTFAAFLGAVDASVPSGILGACVAVSAIFAPSFLLVAAAMPLWAELRTLPRAGAALAGINTAVVGLLAAVLVDPLFLALARNHIGTATAIAAFALLQFAKWPPWAIVGTCAAAGAAYRSWTP